MKFGMPLIAVRDMQVSKAFYQAVLSQNVKLDLGDYVELESLALRVNFEELVGAGDLPITFRPNDHELYFDEEDFDGFLARLAQYPDIAYLHQAKEYPWGQRVIRFYDPDGHIIEVGECMDNVFRRFHQQGMNAQQIAERTQLPLDAVRRVVPS